MLISLEEIKDYLRIDYEEDDNMLQSLGVAAYSYLENAINDFEAKTQDEGFKEKAKLVSLAMIQEWYDNREAREQKSLTYTIRALMLQLQTQEA